MTDAIYTIQESTLTDIADAIRSKKGTSAPIAVTDLADEIADIDIPVVQSSKTVTTNGTVTPDAGYDAIAEVVVNVSGGQAPLTLGYTFNNNEASNAYGTVTLTSYSSDYDGNYDLYWANDDGILPNYTKLNMLTILAVDHSSTPTVFDKFNQYNAIPKYATKLVAVLASDANKVIKATYNIPSSKLWQSGDWGNKKGTQGWLSDIHLQYETGSDDWARCFTYCDQREGASAILIAGDLTSTGAESHLTGWRTERDAIIQNVPVYACNGNHESLKENSYMVTNPTQIREFLDTDWVDETVNYFTKTINGVLNVFVPIFEGVQDSRGNAMFSSTVLSWLEDLLEEHRNERVIVWAHCLPNTMHHPYGFGDMNGLYHSYKSWGYTDDTTLQDRFDFLDLIDHYKNVVWVSGHTHIRYYYQEQFTDLNVVRQTGGGAYLVHLSSVTVPRDIVDGNPEQIFAESEGTICDVYENCLRLRSRDFAGEKFYGLCEYIIPNDIIEIPSKAKVLDSISAVKTTTTYNVGDTLSTSDIVTTATFTDTTTATVQGTYDTQNVNMLVAGTYNIGVSYTFNGVTKTTTVSITVVETQTKALASISAVKTTITYTVNDTLSTSDIVVTATYTDSTSANVTASAVYDTSNVDMTTAGTYTIGVSYTEDGVTKTATITITVSAPSGYSWTYIDNTTINYSTGEITSNSDYGITTRFPVEAGKTYLLDVDSSVNYGSNPKIRVVAFATTDSTTPVGSSQEIWNGQAEHGGTYTIPSGASYALFRINKKYLAPANVSAISDQTITFTKQ